MKWPAMLKMNIKKIKDIRCPILSAMKPIIGIMNTDTVYGALSRAPMVV